MTNNDVKQHKNKQIGNTSFYTTLKESKKGQNSSSLSSIKTFICIRGTSQASKLENHDKTFYKQVLIYDCITLYLNGDFLKCI